MAFRYEKDLSAVVIKYNVLPRLVGIRPSKVYIIPEVEGYFGIPDFVLYDMRKKTRKKERIYAFECKLKNWRRALIQAYRYKAFSGISYVVMDIEHIKPAVKNLPEFKKSNVGLIGVMENGDYDVFFSPEYEEPFTETMYFDLLNEIESSLKQIKPFWEGILELAESIPEEELDKLPTDGAMNIDYYVYGIPKNK